MNYTDFENRMSPRPLDIRNSWQLSVYLRDEQYPEWLISESCQYANDVKAAQGPSISGEALFDEIRIFLQRRLNETQEEEAK